MPTQYVIFRLWTLHSIKLSWPPFIMIDDDDERPPIHTACGWNEARGTRASVERHQSSMSGTGTKGHRPGGLPMLFARHMLRLLMRLK